MFWFYKVILNLSYFFLFLGFVCGSGYYFLGGDTVCIFCFGGYFCIIISFSFVLCIVGNYVNNVSIICLFCVVGYYCFIDGMSEFLVCFIGYY